MGSLCIHHAAPAGLAAYRTMAGLSAAQCSPCGTQRVCPHVAEIQLPPAWKDVAFKSLFTDCDQNPKECKSPFHKYMCTICYKIICAKCTGESRVQHFKETGHPVTVKYKLDFYCCGCGGQPIPAPGLTAFKKL